ncbi:hypothetical protein [Planctellipticum variicoloris]|uniref:hypothetical protein n=1 Tax=Planctellipticum variicoloris TaxID=3064265 RepID=UPI0030137AC6|nr:DUF2599 domain-containing protein [Planctomycetaceae bacterium SH412]
MIAAAQSAIDAVFIRFDVAAVCVLAAVPLAAVVVNILRGRLPRLLLGSLLFGIAVALVVIAAGMGSHVLRLLVAVLSTTGVGLVLAGMADATSASVVRRFRGAGAIALALAILAVIPAVFVDARVRHDLKLLTELLEQTRLGEASELTGRIAALQPSADWQGRPLAALRRDLDRTVADLRSRAAVPLLDSADPLARVDRARDLAILGDTDAALNVLSDRRIAAIEDPEVMNLRGTIHETRSEWTAARDWYRRARQASEGLPASEAGLATRLQAQRGIAYAERKAGRMPEAEAAYRELLALSPTADTHFLLAQFYEDGQHADLARTHARRAMDLDPRRYAREGRQLIDKLQTVHFGCFVTFQAERSSGGSGRGP